MYTKTLFSTRPYMCFKLYWIVASKQNPHKLDQFYKNTQYVSAIIMHCRFPAPFHFFAICLPACSLTLIFTIL